MEKGYKYIPEPTDREDVLQLANYTLQKNESRVIPREEITEHVVEHLEKNRERVIAKGSKGKKPSFSIGMKVLIRTKKMKKQLATKKDLTGERMYPFVGEVAEIGNNGFSIKVKWIEPPSGEEIGELSKNSFAGDLVKIPLANPDTLPPVPTEIGVPKTKLQLLQDSPDILRIPSSLFAEKISPAFDNNTVLETTVGSVVNEKEPTDADDSLIASLRSRLDDPAFMDKISAILPLSPKSTPKKSTGNSQIVLKWFRKAKAYKYADSFSCFDRETIEIFLYIKGFYRSAEFCVGKERIHCRNSASNYVDVMPSS